MRFNLEKDLLNSKDNANRKIDGIRLISDPVEDMEPATKKYTDETIAEIVSAIDSIEVADTSITIAGPYIVPANTTTNYIITNYDFKSTYSVSVDIGTATIEENIITYTAPDTPSAPTITVRRNQIEKSITINVVELTINKVNKPYITYPTSENPDISMSDSILSSPFSYEGESQSHISTEWEIADNIFFTNSIPVYNSGAVTSLSLGDLISLNMFYYVRVRYEGSLTGWSEWSDPVMFRVVSSTVVTPARIIFYENLVDNLANDSVAYKLVEAKDYQYGINRYYALVNTTLEPEYPDAAIIKYDGYFNPLSVKGIDVTTRWDNATDMCINYENNIPYIYLKAFNNENSFVKEPVIVKLNEYGEVLWARKHVNIKFEPLAIHPIETHDAYPISKGVVLAGKGRGIGDFSTNMYPGIMTVGSDGRYLGGAVFKDKPNTAEFTDVATKGTGFDIEYYAAGSEIINIGEYQRKPVMAGYNYHVNGIWYRSFTGLMDGKFTQVLVDSEGYIITAGQGYDQNGNEVGFISKHDPAMNGAMIKSTVLSGLLIQSMTESIENGQKYYYVGGLGRFLDDYSNYFNYNYYGAAKLDSNFNVVWAFGVTDADAPISEFAVDGRANILDITIVEDDDGEKEVVLNGFEDRTSRGPDGYDNLTPSLVGFSLRLPLTGFPYTGQSVNYPYLVIVDLLDENELAATDGLSVFTEVNENITTTDMNPGGSVPTLQNITPLVDKYYDFADFTKRSEF